MAACQHFVAWWYWSGTPSHVLAKRRRLAVYAAAAVTGTTGMLVVSVIAGAKLSWVARGLAPRLPLLLLARELAMVCSFGRCAACNSWLVPR